MKMAFSGLTFILLRMTYTNCPTVKSDGTKYLWRHAQNQVSAALAGIRNESVIQGMTLSVLTTFELSLDTIQWRQLYVATSLILINNILLICHTNCLIGGASSARYAYNAKMKGCPRRHSGYFTIKNILWFTILISDDALSSKREPLTSSCQYPECRFALPSQQSPAKTHHECQ